MEYGLRTFFCLEEGNALHRYVQIGMESDAGDFTGVIIDYAGGGVYGNFYFLDGQCLNFSAELAEADDDVLEGRLEKTYPGIIEHLYDTFDRYARWDWETCTYELTEPFITEFGPFPQDGRVIIGDKGLSPIYVANTYFPGWKIPEGMDTDDDSEAEPYECPVHGSRKPAFVCRHLEKGSGLGFIEGAEWPGAEEQINEAWCIDCDTVRAEQGGWNAVAQNHASLRAVCDLCYEEISMRNL
jgi:hypothetical protein